MKNNIYLPDFWVVIPAAGIGQRMQMSTPKQYLLLGQHTVLEHTLNCFLGHPQLKGIIVCLSAHDRYWSNLTVSNHSDIEIVVGGRERADSVLAGLSLLDKKANPDDWVLVHDAARPNLKHADLNKLLVCLANDEVGGLLATPVRDTLKQVNAEGRVQATLDRKMIWQALTPQMFRLGILKRALQLAGQTVTDEASAIEQMGLFPRLVEGRSDNLKITHPEDLQWLMPYFAGQKLNHD